MHRGIISKSTDSAIAKSITNTKDERQSENRPKSKHKSNYTTSPDISMESDEGHTDQGNSETNDVRNGIGYFEPITFQETLTSVESNVLVIDGESVDVFGSNLGFEDDLARKGPHSIEMLTTPLMGLDEEKNSDE